MEVFPKRKILSIALFSLGIAFAIGMYYAFLDSPLLFPIGIAEGFFLFAYNLELFGGKFHNNISTVVSWGILPVFAGSAIQTNSISTETILLSIVSALLTYFLITTSRKYKKLKTDGMDLAKIQSKENILKPNHSHCCGGNLSRFLSYVLSRLRICSMILVCFLWHKHYLKFIIFLENTLKIKIGIMLAVTGIVGILGIMAFTAYQKETIPLDCSGNARCFTRKSYPNH